MKSRLLLVLTLLFGAFAFGSAQDRALASPDEGAAPPPPRMVVTWVPPYNLLVTRQRLRAFYGDAGPRKGLTHLALQFWVPAADGGLARASSVRRALAQRAHARGKVITIDSFPWKFNGPNWTWWPALFPHVDAINSMGYAEIGRNATGWARYSNQLAHAGSNAAKLNISMPSNLNNWQGNVAVNQVRWMTLAVAGRSGVAIWDAQNPAATWRSQNLWRLLREIRED